MEEETAHLSARVKKLQNEASDSTQLEVDKMTLEMKVTELEQKFQNGGTASLTPKTDRKLNKIYGIFGKFYGKGVH